MQKKQQSSRSLFAVSMLFAALVGGRAQAASFIVPADQELIQKAKAIAVGTVVSTRSQQTESGRIETVATVSVDEVIKGKLQPATQVELHELGGIIGSIGYIVPGSPSYQPGEHVLVMLEQNRKGEWTTQDLALGRFDFAADKGGRRLLVRDEEAIVGWDTKGRVHHEKPRLEREFLDFVRQNAKGKAVLPNYFVDAAPATIGTMSTAPAPSVSAATAYGPSAYLSTITMNGVTRGARWPSFGAGVKFYNRGNQSGWADGGIGAIQAAMAAWTNDPASNVVYQYGGTTTAANGLNAYDTVNSIQFNDPNGEIAGTFTGSGTLGIGGFWVDGSTNVQGGETLYSITYGDVIIQDGVSPTTFNASRFNQLLTHEVGHTLGFRHSDQGTPSTTAAVMRASLVDDYGAVLQQYDRDAVDTVYGSGSTVAVSVSSFSPLRVNASTPTNITITGSGFQPGATVTVAGIAASSVVFGSSTSLTARTPSLGAGWSYFVVVRNPDGTTAQAAQTIFSNFNDVPNSNPVAPQVESIARAGITTGCGNGNYCPGSIVNRAQMSKFLLAGKHGSGYVPPAATGIFNDVPRSDTFASWIEQLYREGITSGCGAGTYCPQSAVTRAQMAKFLLLAKHGSSYAPPAATGMFTDVPRNDLFATWIEQLYREGITGGCASGSYCPSAPVTRSEMATFLQRTFALPLNP